VCRACAQVVSRERSEVHESSSDRELAFTRASCVATTSVAPWRAACSVSRSTASPAPHRRDSRSFVCEQEFGPVDHRRAMATRWRSPAKARAAPRRLIGYAERSQAVLDAQVVLRQLGHELREAQVVAHGEVAHQVKRLQDVPTVAPRQRSSSRRRASAGSRRDLDVAFGGPDQACDHVQQRGLTAARGPSTASARPALRAIRQAAAPRCRRSVRESLNGNHSLGETFLHAGEKDVFGSFLPMNTITEPFFSFLPRACPCPAHHHVTPWNTPGADCPTSRAPLVAQEIRAVDLDHSERNCSSFWPSKGLSDLNTNDRPRRDARGGCPRGTPDRAAGSR